MSLRQAYDTVLASHQASRGTPLLWVDFWLFVGRNCGKSAGAARFLARRAGWPTTCGELGLLRRPVQRTPKPPRPKTPHTKTVCARLRAILPLLAKHPIELQLVQDVIDRLEVING